ncbi:hypothetical protein [Chlorogloea sp. CCALA 695]|uniref:hypothetical protein n=1 Tax=Chlorogloea sp. CCALA 695 TaxID=2107693 RepID=UPI000D057BA3|nr:hypothetical protein [Chlorogloea sp. CCALA 695]PSB28691.1 hypothetical protein C7B70_20475 [Chlorogloea sp. CCALA 695]
MQTIDDLRSEIQSFENEIAKLKQDLIIVGGYFLELASINDPSATATSFQVDRAPAIQEIKNAIAELTARLALKKVQLEELEKQQVEQ